MYRLSDLMKMFDIPERTIRRHIKEGILKGSKAGGTWRFSEEDISNYLNQAMITERLSKTAVKNIFDYLNGYALENDEVAIIKKIPKANYAKSVKISLLVNNLENPFVFNMTNKGSSSIITFKGTENDVMIFLNQINDIVN